MRLPTRQDGVENGDKVYNDNSANFSGEKKYNDKFRGVYFLTIREKT